MIVDPCSGEIRDRMVDRGQSPLEVLSDLLERATDAYRDALDGEAEARCEYEREFAMAFLVSDKVAATIRSKWADSQPKVLEARLALHRAEAAAKRCRAKTQEVSARLVAAQSNIKFLGMGDGGQR